MKNLKFVINLLISTACTVLALIPLVIISLTPYNTLANAVSYNPATQILTILGESVPIPVSLLNTLKNYPISATSFVLSLLPSFIPHALSHLSSTLTTIIHSVL
jgi:hypothetical protein